MGAGHMMSTSIHKTANFLVRLHMSVEIARRGSSYAIDTLPINDGIFIVSTKKGRAAGAVAIGATTANPRRPCVAALWLGEIGAVFGDS
jgi:hypothetical protein